MQVYKYGFHNFNFCRGSCLHFSCCRLVIHVHLALLGQKTLLGSNLNPIYEVRCWFLSAEIASSRTLGLKIYEPTFEFNLFVLCTKLTGNIISPQTPPQSCIKVVLHISSHSYRLLVFSSCNTNCGKRGRHLRPPRRLQKAAYAGDYSCPMLFRLRQIHGGKIMPLNMT